MKQIILTLILNLLFINEIHAQMLLKNEVEIDSSWAVFTDTRNLFSLSKGAVFKSNRLIEFKKNQYAIDLYKGDPNGAFERDALCTLEREPADSERLILQKNTELIFSHFDESLLNNSTVRYLNFENTNLWIKCLNIRREKLEINPFIFLKAIESTFSINVAIPYRKILNYELDFSSINKLGFSVKKNITLPFGKPILFIMQKTLITSDTKNPDYKVNISCQFSFNSIEDYRESLKMTVKFYIPKGEIFFPIEMFKSRLQGRRIIMEYQGWNEHPTENRKFQYYYSDGKGLINLICDYGRPTSESFSKICSSEQTYCSELNSLERENEQKFFTLIQENFNKLLPQEFN